MAKNKTQLAKVETLSKEAQNAWAKAVVNGVVDSEEEGKLIEETKDNVIDIDGMLSVVSKALALKDLEVDQLIKMVAQRVSFIDWALMNKFNDVGIEEYGELLKEFHEEETRAKEKLAEAEEKNADE